MSDDIAFLTSPQGHALCQQLASLDLSNPLPLLTRLRKDYTPQQAAAAVTMARLRQKAKDKFGVYAASMLFTEVALEQASHPAVRRYRAQRIGTQSMLDAGCGIGADSLAFAAEGAEVYGLDLDPVRVEMARHNARVMGLENARFAVQDVRERVLTTDGTIFYDPARRDAQGRRIFDVERYIPSLSLVRGWQADRIVVKLSPGVALDQLSAYGGQVEFISVDGDLKEAVLWLGDGSMAATLIQASGAVLHWQPSAYETVPTGPPADWLVEPDPSLIRAGYVQDVVAQTGGHQLDETIAYITTQQRPESPWLRSWAILDWMPFHLKRLRAYLRDHNVGRVTVKKRGSPITPEELTARLKLRGTESRTLILTRFQGQSIVIICADYTL